MYLGSSNMGQLGPCLVAWSSWAKAWVTMSDTEWEIAKGRAMVPNFQGVKGVHLGRERGMPWEQGLAL